MSPLAVLTIKKKHLSYKHSAPTKLLFVHVPTGLFHQLLKCFVVLLLIVLKEIAVKLSVLLSSIILCLFAASNVAAQNPQTPNPCEDAQTTVEMRDCAGRDYKQADAELNALYKQLMATLSDKEHQASLRSAQQAWLKYRDANCEFDAFENRGGTIYPVVYTSCLATMTTARTKELREQTEQEGH
jgi:uncharacterized protein YecT (DUF1311 family)